MTISSPSASSASPAPLASGKPDRESGCVARPPACDCHFHVFTARESSPGARYQPAYTASFGDWRALSGKAGIGRGIVVQPSFLGVDNRVLLQTLQQAPEALRGVAVVADNVNLVEMRRLHDTGVRGIRLNLMGMNDDAEHLRALPSAWWGNLMASGMHLELHADVGRIATLLPWVPSGVTVVLDHFAKPAAANADDPTLRAVQRRAGNGDAVYITLSGVYRLGGSDERSGSMPGNDHARALARLWLDVLGSKRLLWGSDWPCTNHEAHADYDRLRSQLDWLIADDATRAAILADNPAALYWRA